MAKWIVKWSGCGITSEIIGGRRMRKTNAVWRRIIFPVISTAGLLISQYASRAQDVYVADEQPGSNYYTVMGMMPEREFRKSMASLNRAPWTESPGLQCQELISMYRPIYRASAKRWVSTILRLEKRSVVSVLRPVSRVPWGWRLRMASYMWRTARMPAPWRHSTRRRGLLSYFKVFQVIPCLNRL